MATALMTKNQASMHLLVFLTPCFSNTCLSQQLKKNSLVSSTHTHAQTHTQKDVHLLCKPLTECCPRCWEKSSFLVLAVLLRLQPAMVVKQQDVLPCVCVCILTTCTRYVPFWWGAWFQVLAPPEYSTFNPVYPSKGLMNEGNFTEKRTFPMFSQKQ